jgi:hypothetical protein
LAIIRLNCSCQVLPKFSQDLARIGAVKIFPTIVPFWDHYPKSPVFPRFVPQWLTGSLPFLPIPHLELPYLPSGIDLVGQSDGAVEEKDHVEQEFCNAAGGAALASVAMAGCADARTAPRLPSANFVALQEGPGEDYVIGPMDELTVFVWRNPELGARTGPARRPYHHAADRGPARHGQDAQHVGAGHPAQLSQYIQDPLVSVIVNRFAGTFSEQIRIVGATGRPASIPYRANMTIWTR